MEWRKYVELMYKLPMHKKSGINALNNKVDLKRIQHFALLGQERHFSRAAERANLSQTAFSRSIRSLEDDLQLRLFDRDTRTVELTAAGRQLLAYANELLKSANNLAAEADYLANAEGGELRFGASKMMAHSLPMTLHELRTLSPRLMLNVEINHGESLSLKLLEESIEFFVANADPLVDDTRFHITPLLEETSVLACRSDHPLARHRGDLSREQLLSYPWASVRFDAPTIRRLCQLFQVGDQRQLPISLSCSDLGVLRHALYNSDTLLATWSAWLQDDLQQGKAIDLSQRVSPPLTTTPLVLSCSIVQLARRTLSPSARLAIELLRKHARQQQ